MKFYICVFLLAIFVGESQACRYRTVDVIDEVNAAQNVSINIITAASSVDAETEIEQRFSNKLQKREGDEQKLHIGCGVCYSSSQTVNIRTTSERPIKGNPKKHYGLEFSTCIDKSDYALFSRVAIFDFGEDVTW